MNALIAQAKLQQQQDQNAQARAKLALSAPQSEASNSVRGDILAKSQDATISGLPSYIHVPTIGGGLRPSMLSANSRALGANMSRNALLNNISGKDVPDLTPLPQANAYDSILQGVGTGAGFLNAVGGMLKPSAGGPTSSTMPVPSGPQDGNPGADTGPINALPGETGIDPNELAWWQQQAMPTGAQ